MNPRSIVVASACVALGACSLGKPVPATTTYVVDIPPPAAGVSATSRPDAIRMGDVHVAAAYAGPALVYRISDVQHVSDPYNAFIADPGDMIGNAIAQWLESAGAFGSVSLPGQRSRAHSVLEATVTELYGDFRPGRTPLAVVAVQFSLVSVTPGGLQPDYQRTIRATAPLAEASPEALVRGYGEALSDALDEFLGDMPAPPVE